MSLTSSRNHDSYVRDLVTRTYSRTYRWELLGAPSWGLDNGPGEGPRPRGYVQEPRPGFPSSGSRVRIPSAALLFSSGKASSESLGFWSQERLERRQRVVKLGVGGRVALGRHGRISVAAQHTIEGGVVPRPVMPFVTGCLQGSRRRMPSRRGRHSNRVGIAAGVNITKQRAP